MNHCDKRGGNPENKWTPLYPQDGAHRTTLQIDRNVYTQYKHTADSRW